MTYWTDHYRPLRVCIVVPYDLSQPGGGVKHHAFQLARALRAGGDDAVVLGPASVPVRTPEVQGLRGVVNIVSNGDNNRMGLFIAPWRLRKFFRENHFDVIHLHEPMVPSICYWTAWLTPGVPKICTFHAFGEEPHWMLRAAHKMFAAIQFPFFERAIAVSESAASYASLAWSRPMAIVPNGIRTDDFQPVPASPSQALRLLFVGALDAERKGFRYLLDAYRSLRDRGVAVTLDVVGPRGAADPPPAMEGLTYHGAVSLSDLVARYQACDVFVAPSTGQESFGIVLLEAMAAGCAVVASDIHGYKRVVQRNVSGLLVEPRDPDALAGAIERLIADPDLRRRLGEAGSRRAPEFDWTHVTAELVNVYESVIARREKPAPVATSLPASTR
jgi:phosphatidyl-myo-inositol alpha-mannosyltransferase